ncbi:MAG: D-tyrosyl-tRNA(Tyr) deacylase [Gemmatimonadetes bacterium]|jgi:D-aminoacyl-tRNA deacylase|nr:D-tyrosyl-tRNA(Tyr) deacylase [Gemmatimonadota bacterium]
MRVLLQRVCHAQVTVDGTIVGRIDQGLVALVGVHGSDTLVETHFCADKCAQVRIFADSSGRFDRSVLDVGGQILAISQFTLYGDCRKGRRPFFGEAADPVLAEPLYEAFIARLQKVHSLTVARGVFGAHMALEMLNDGPVTLMIDSPGKSI